MFKKCFVCGQIIKTSKDSKITCCGKEMKTLKTNDKDASFEKHIPNYEIMYKRIKITVNHPMDEDHYIEWIMIENEQETHIKRLKPSEEATAEFDMLENATIYAYCNKHGLWKKEVE